MKGARHICVALDGTRLGNKDVNFLAIGGVAADKRFRIMWAPVMVANGPGAGGVEIAEPMGPSEFGIRRCLGLEVGARRPWPPLACLEGVVGVRAAFGLTGGQGWPVSPPPGGV